MYKHILAPTDGSALSLKAVKSAAKLAKALGARVSGLYVMPENLPPVYGEASLYITAVSPTSFKAAIEKQAKVRSTRPKKWSGRRAWRSPG